MKTVSLITFIGLIALLCLIPTHYISAGVIDGGYDSSLPRVYVSAWTNGKNLPTAISDIYIIENYLRVSVKNYNYAGDSAAGRQKNYLQSRLSYDWHLRLWLAGYKINYPNFPELNYERSGAGSLGPSRGRWTQLSRFIHREHASIDLSRTSSGIKTIKASSRINVSADDTSGTNNRKVADSLWFYFINPFE